MCDIFRNFLQLKMEKVAFKINWSSNKTENKDILFKTSKQRRAIIINWYFEPSGNFK